MVLKSVCSIDRPYKAAVPSAEFASVIANPSAAGLGNPKRFSVIVPTNCKKGLNNINAQITPNKLKMVWDIAARLACVLPTEAAMFAVIVVPMFSPSTIAHAMLKGIQPRLNMIRVMAIVADDDCSTNVKTVPNARNRSTEPKP